MIFLIEAMLKVKPIQKKLRKKWYSIIKSIESAKTPFNQIQNYLQSNFNPYTNYILQLLLLAKKRKKPKLSQKHLYQKHHSFPKSIGGPNASWNLVTVTLEEHRKAHVIRSKVYNEYVDENFFITARRRNKNLVTIKQKN